MKQGADCLLFKTNPQLIKDDPLNSALCGHFKKAFAETLAKMTPAIKQKPTSLLKAFYENLHLVNLYPLIDTDFDIEIGNETWIKAIGNYKTYGRR